ncbi:hypothetical protein HDU89_006628 [Geranomyces variabilis]|nr:hypothetical protein HDU89_006628 [Geranomyces variabilis]
MTEEETGHSQSKKDSSAHMEHDDAAEVDTPKYSALITERSLTDCAHSTKARAGRKKQRRTTVEKAVANCEARGKEFPRQKAPRIHQSDRDPLLHPSEQMMYAESAFAHVMTVLCSRPVSNQSAGSDIDSTKATDESANTTPIVTANQSADTSPSKATDASSHEEPLKGSMLSTDSSPSKKPPAASLESQLSVHSCVSATLSASKSNAENPFMRKSNTQASWDDLVEDEDDEPVTPAKPSTPKPPSMFSSGIRPSSLGAFHGSSLGTGKLGGSSWGAAALSKVGDAKVTPPSAKDSKITPIPGMNTPQKFSFGPSGFSAFATHKSPFTFGSKVEDTAATPKKEEKTDPNAAEPGRTTPPPRAGAGDDAANFASLLATPHKNAFGNLRVHGTPYGPRTGNTASEKSHLLDHEEEVFKKRGKLHAYVDKTWRERGRGLMSVIVDKEREGHGRAVMSADGTWRLLLNAGITKTLKPKVTQSKSVSFLAFLPTNTPDEPQTLTSFMLTFQEAAWAQEFVDLIEGIKAKHPNAREESPDDQE